MADHSIRTSTIFHTDSLKMDAVFLHNVREMAL